MAELTAKEIVAIIRAGNEAKVAKFEGCGITVTFKDGEQEALTHIYQQTPEYISDTPETASKPDEELDDNFLGLVDPMAYEERLLAGDLADAKA